MAVSIGPKLGIDGEKEYRDSINQIIQQAKTLGSEMKLVTASFDENTEAEEKAQRTAEVLNKQIDVQKKRVDALNGMLEKSADLYGANDTKTLKWQEAVNDANAELKNLERQLDETQSGLSGFADSLDDSAGSLDDMSGALSETGEAAGAASGTLGDLAGKFGIDLPDALGEIDLGGINTDMLGLAGVLGAAAGYMVEIGKETIELAENLKLLSGTSGLSTTALQEWGYAGEQAGVSMEEIADLTKDLRKNAVAAVEGNEEMAKSFEELGVTLTDENGNIRDTDDLFNDVVYALANMEEGAERDTLAMSLMGEGALKLNPIINDGAEALDNMKQAAHENNQVLSEEGVAAVDKFHKRLDNLVGKIKGSFRQAFAELAQWLNGDWDYKGVAVGGKAWDSGIGRNARGTDYWQGGWTLVGEEGPELLRLPQGTQIKSNAESAAMMGGVNITVYGAEGQDVEALADEIMYRINDAVARQEAIYR